MSEGMRPNRATVGLGVIASIVAITCVGVASAQSGGGGGDDSASAAKRVHRYHGPRIKTANSSRCDWFDPSVCLQPWPNDRFTTKAATATGKRLNLNAKSMPKNKSGVGIDPVDYNRNDGFSPGQLIVVHIPGMDNQTAFNKSGIVPVDNIRKYADPAQPVVVIDAATGARNPIFAEMDVHALKNSDRQLIIHPSNNFDEGHRYIVALRNLKNAKGRKIKPSNAFKVYRDRLRTRQRPVEKRRKHMESLFRTLRKAGIRRKKLVLAWDFTVASESNLAGRALAARNDAFADLGDTNLANGTVEGSSPTTSSFSTTDFAPCSTNLPACEPGEDDEIIRKVEGHMAVPCYLNQNGCPSGSKFAYSNASDMTPNFNQAFTMDVPFECLIPRSIDGGGGDVNPAAPALFGHGLLGDHLDVDSDYNRRFAFEHNVIWCAVDWAGFASEDITPVIFPALKNLSNLAKTFDRTQQGYVDFLYMGRAMISSAGNGGLNSKSAFQFDFGNGSQSAIDTSDLFFEGISQGGIMGGALTALSPDFTRGALNVNGMGYSTLLERSVDFDDYANIPNDGLYPSYPKLRERPLLLSLIQIIWDRGEAGGYAQHMTTDPYANTPPHQVLMHLAYGDHQVSNITAENEARTVGASRVATTLKPGRHWDVNPYFGIPAIGSFPFTGSAMVYWDGGPVGFTGTGGDPPGGNTEGTGKVPTTNVPNRTGDDPHSYPRRVAAARSQIFDFWNGQIEFPCGGASVNGSVAPCFSNGYLGTP